MGKKLRARLFIALLAAGVMALAACTPKPASAPATPTAPPAAATQGTKPVTTPSKSAADQQWQTVLAAARREGSLNLYTTFAPPDLRVALNKTMQDEYGIKVEWLVASGGAANAERIRVEHKAKQYVADVWWTGFSVLLTNQLREANALESFTPPIVAAQPGVWRGKGIDSVTDARDALTITQKSSDLPIVNSKILRPEDYPKSYKDLLDPKWKGKMVMHDPTVPGGGAYLFGILKAAYGLEFWEKAKGQDISVIRDYGEVARRVAVGEATIGLGLTPSAATNLMTAGAPIKFFSLSEGALKINGPMYLISNAPHPNAAKVFLNWTLTKEGQAMISRTTGDEPIRTDVEYDTFPELKNAIRDTPKWVIGDWKVIEGFDADVAAGTARKVLGLK